MLVTQATELAEIFHYDEADERYQFVEGSSLYSLLIEIAAERRKIATHRLSPTIVILQKNDKIVPFYRSVGSSISSAAVVISKNKHITKTMLRKAGLSVSRGSLFEGRHLDQALAFFDKIDDAVVLKPNSSSQGNSVYCDIDSSKKFSEYWKEMKGTRKSGNQKEILVEEMFNGSNFRIFVVDRRVVSVTLRLPPSVLGDGIRSVAELIEVKNKYRILNPNLRTKLIRFDDMLDRYLISRGLTSDSVPTSGEQVVLDHRANVSVGGDSINCENELHPSYFDIAIRAADAIPGMHYCGIDMIVRDPSAPATDDNYVVGEVEGRPALTAHFPVHGIPRDVAGAIVDHYF